MPGLILTGILTFVATNIDDIVLLVMFFSQANASLTQTAFRPRHVVVGQHLGFTLGIFFSLVGVWCLIGYRLTHRQAVATLMTHYGHIIVPFILIGLGVFILIESGTLSLIGL